MAATKILFLSACFISVLSVNGNIDLFGGRCLTKGNFEKYASYILSNTSVASFGHGLFTTLDTDKNNCITYSEMKGLQSKSSQSNTGTDVPTADGKEVVSGSTISVPVRRFVNKLLGRRQPI